MNTPTVPSWLQFLAKGGLLASAIVLAILHHLTPEVAMVLSSALVALGVTNGAQLVAQGVGVVSSLAPPTKPAAPAPPASTTAAAVAAMIGVPLMALIMSACGAYQPTPQEVALQNKGIDELCALHAAAEKLRADAGPDAVWSP
jgi:hypothetical protein